MGLEWQVDDSQTRAVNVEMEEPVLWARAHERVWGNETMLTNNHVSSRCYWKVMKKTEEGGW